MANEAELVVELRLSAADGERLKQLAGKAGKLLPDFAAGLVLMGLELAEAEVDSRNPRPIGPGGMDDDIPF